MKAALTERSIFVVIVCGIALACRDNPVSCPADVSEAAPQGPVLTVVPSLTSALTTAVDTFSISNIRLNGNPVSALPISLVCNIACGFGTDSGTYTFTISARSRRDTTVTVDAFYRASVINTSTAHGCGQRHQLVGTITSVVLPPLTTP